MHPHEEVGVYAVYAKVVLLPATPFLSKVAQGCGPVRRCAGASSTHACTDRFKRVAWQSSGERIR